MNPQPPEHTGSEPSEADDANIRNVAALVADYVSPEGHDPEEWAQLCELAEKILRKLGLWKVAARTQALEADRERLIEHRRMIEVFLDFMPYVAEHKERIETDHGPIPMDPDGKHYITVEYVDTEDTIRARKLYLEGRTVVYKDAARARQTTQRT